MRQEKSGNITRESIGESNYNRAEGKGKTLRLSQFFNKIKKNPTSFLIPDRALNSSVKNSSSSQSCSPHLQ